MFCPKELCRRCPGSWHCRIHMKNAPPDQNQWIWLVSFDHLQLPCFECFCGCSDTKRDSSLILAFLKRGNKSIHMRDLFINVYKYIHCTFYSTWSDQFQIQMRSLGPILKTCPSCWSATRSQHRGGALCDKGHMVFARLWKPWRVAVLNCAVNVEGLRRRKRLWPWWSSRKQNHVQRRIWRWTNCADLDSVVSHRFESRRRFHQWSCFQECSRKHPSLHFGGLSSQSSR